MFRKYKHILRALRHRNFRLFFLGQGISLIGTWMQTVTMGWLVFRLTHSTALLGIVGFADKIPIFALTSSAGVLVDRYNKFKILVVTQILSMIQASLLAYLVLSGKIQVWHIIVLAAFLGTVNSIDIPARQSFILEMIEDKEDLGNAIALNSSIFNGARLVGPSIGGILIALVGEGYCFLINALSFIAVIAALLSMNILAKPRKSGHAHPLVELKEGFSYAFGFAPTRNILLLICLFSLTAMPFVVLLPAFAKNILAGGPNTFGFLMASTGAGALLGAIYLASRKSVLGLGRWIVVASTLFSLTLIALSFTSSIWLSMALMPLAGFGMMVHMASSNTILQTVTDDDKRGRVIGIFVTSMTGMAPFGSLIAGALASRLGIPWEIRLGGIVCLAGSMLFASKLDDIRKLIHPIYTELGILKDPETIRDSIELAAKIETMEES